MVKNLAVLLASVMVILGFGSFAAAQTQEELSLWTYGTVLKADGAQMTLKEFDIVEEKDVEKVYAVNAQTAYEGVGSLSEIQAGDEIEVQYQETPQGNVALLIFKGEEASDDIYSDEDPQENMNQGTPDSQEEPI